MMDFESPQQRMVWEIREKYGLDSPKVLAAMLQIPREEFVSDATKNLAYEDEALSIGFGQTISQPYTVAFMTHLLTEKRDTKEERILEIGTGSGYQAALLSLLAKKVYTIERIPELAEEASKRLKRLGFKDIRIKIASSDVGWESEAPFDAILVTAGLSNGVSDKLLEQLKDGGVMVAPIGEGENKVMTRYRKLKNGKTEKLKKEEFGTFNFVPFIEG